MTRRRTRVVRAALCCVSLYTASAAPGAQAQAPTEPVASRATLVAASRTLHDALTSGEVSVLAPLLATDYALTDSRGRLHDRASVLAIARRRDVELEHALTELSELRVTIAGPTGVITGIADEALHFHGRDEHRRLRFTEVWIESQTGWQLLASHESGAVQSRVHVPEAATERTP